MFVEIATAFVRFSMIFLPAAALALLAVGAVRGKLPPVRAAWAIGTVAVLLGAWATGMVPLAKIGILMPPATFVDPPYILIPLIGGALFLWALGRFTPTGRTIIGGLDQRHLIGFQVFRVMGALFLFGWLMGDIPWQFALPAGIGDIWAGIAAMQALNALHRRAPDAQALVMRANVIGLLDFAVAVSTGLMTSEGFLHLMAFDAPNIINMYPLALFPAFFVPLFIAFHLFSLEAMKQEKSLGGSSVMLSRSE
tara:strand:- start:4411 stop:5166 length:756 start_codon:yes stop_codon:yes gene_type:complete